MLLNPALTGAAIGSRLMTAYRSQWGSAPNAHRTFFVATDHLVEKWNSGLGISILGDDGGNGAYQQYSIGLHYAYNLTLSDKWFMAMGFETTLNQARINRSKLVFYDQFDAYGNVNSTAENLPNTASRLYGDLGTGIVIYSKQFYGGVAVRHLNVPSSGVSQRDDVFAAIPIRATAHVGANFLLPRKGYNKDKDNYYISPNLMLTTQGASLQVTGGATARLSAVFVGTYLRYTPSGADALLLHLGFQKDLVRFGYSYDYTLSALNTLGGTHELTVVFNAADSKAFKKRYNAQKYSNCMRIFR